MGRHKNAFDEYQDIVKCGQNAIAASNLGYMYHRGIAVMRDYTKAMLYYKAACESDGGAAYFNMALMYMRGQGVDIDFKRAIDLMHRSAELGCADARLYLGLAYIMGYVYDPIEIECVSLIPFYRVIYRDSSAPLLEGEGCDPSIEDGRFEAIESDGEEAVSMYEALMREHSFDPYASKQCAAAQFMLGRAYIEGLGDRYDPMLGYRKIFRTAIDYGSAEAARFLLENSEAARVYKINVDKIELLASYKYFKNVSGNLGTPVSHRVPLLIPADETGSA